MSHSCDLCGTTGGEALQFPSSRSMLSDRRIVPGPLRKLECPSCGLVRGLPAAPTSTSFYETDYRLDGGDHVFHTAAGPRRRSALMADWVAKLAARAGLAMPHLRIFEIGASRGFLLRELADRWPSATLEGLELNAAAAAAARAQQLMVTSTPADEREAGQYDLVIAVAVLEHVPSPTRFLEDIHRLLKPQGHAVLIQPTQNVPSYDVLFVDHLHHFGTEHVRAYARKCGFATVIDDVGFELMPNFSAHLLRAGEPRGAAWLGGPSVTCARATLEGAIRDLGRMAESAAALKAAGRPFGVFGLHEAFAVARTYSSIDDSGIAVGLADDAGHADYRGLGFPVMTPEACAGTGVDDIFLTMNKVHYPFASSRLAGLGLRAIPVFR